VERSKTHLARWYPLHLMAKAVLLSIGPKVSGRVFERWHHKDVISHLAKSALKAAGYGHLRLHDLRHSFAVMLKEIGVDDAAVGDLLGHSDRRATEIYAHITDGRARAALHLIKGGPLNLQTAK